MSKVSKLVFAGAIVASFAFMSFRPKASDEQLIQGKLVTGPVSFKTGKPTTQHLTAAVVAAVEEAAVAAIEATPAVAEYTVVTTVVLAQSAVEGKVSSVSNASFVNDMMKVKAYQLDKK